MQIKIGESGDQKDMVVCSAYFPSDSRMTPPPKESKELVEYCAERKLEPQSLPVATLTHTSHHTVWSGSDINSRGRIYENIS